LSVRFEAIEAVNEALLSAYFLRIALPWEAAFVAGKVFAQYKLKGGCSRPGVGSGFSRIALTPSLL
jgi:hypothetical protein